MTRVKFVLFIVAALLLAAFVGPAPGASGTARTKKAPAKKASRAKAPAAKAKPARGPMLEPVARELLKKTSDYMASLPRFTVHTEVTREVIFPSGLTVDSNRATDLSVERPNHLKADVRSGIRHVQLLYNGKDIVLYTPEQNVYGEVTAAPTIVQVIKTAEQRYGLDLPASEFLFADPYQVMIAKVERGAYVGPSLVDGVMCDQLAFRQKDMDWQLWVARGDQPVPMRLAIVDRSARGAPRYTVTMTDWNTSPQFEAAEFTFTPPEGATQIAVLDLSRLPARAMARK
jgi:hypothetical protein